MKKRAWLWIVPILLLLIFGAIEGHKAQMKRKSEAFRAVFLERAPQGELGRIAGVSFGWQFEDLGVLEGQQLEAALQNVDLA